MGDVLARVVGEHIELRTLTEPDAGRVLVDPAQLEQVILNLVINARDAMPDGGRLTVEVAPAELGDTGAATIGLGPGSYVTLSVSDTGTGMDAHTVEHCFEPFFTTKERTKGTGLGLSTVYGVVSQAGGGVEIDTRVGEGTTVRVYFPASDMSVASSARATAAAAAGRGSEQILLVEDDADVRLLARLLLEQQGYSVLDAGNGAEALAVEAAHDGPLHLLVTDVVMPTMNGVELAARLAERRPEVPVLFMSGYTEDAAGPRGLVSDDAHFLAKPFEPEDLVSRVRDLLDETRAPKKATRKRAPAKKAAKTPAKRR